MTTYLAGPMMGCNDEEMFAWRRVAEDMLKDISDPTIRDYRGVTDQFVNEIVETDKSEIDKCDYVLAYCPRPSYGTIMEILYSWERNKKVIVVVPEGVDISPWLHYHSYIILNTVQAACIYILQDIQTTKTINRKGNKNTMSDSKFRYYTVTTTSVVRANNKTDAIALSMNRRGISGQNLSQETEVDRIPATEARAVVATA